MRHKPFSLRFHLVIMWTNKCFFHLWCLTNSSGPGPRKWRLLFTTIESKDAISIHGMEEAAFTLNVFSVIPALITCQKMFYIEQTKPKQIELINTEIISKTKAAKWKVLEMNIKAEKPRIFCFLVFMESKLSSTAKRKSQHKMHHNKPSNR